MKSIAVKFEADGYKYYVQNRDCGNIAKIVKMNRDNPLAATLLILDDSLRIVGNIHPKNGDRKVLCL